MKTLEIKSSCWVSESPTQDSRAPDTMPRFVKLGLFIPKQSEAASQGRGGQTSNNRPQNQLRGQDTSFGVGSASIQSRNNNQPQIDIDIVQYDATIPDEDEDVDVPILLADPFNEAAERPLTLYGAPPRGR